MNEQVLSKYDVFAVSEGVGSTLKDAHDLVDKDRNELQMAYHFEATDMVTTCLLYTSPSPRDRTRSRMPSSA